MIWLLLLRRWCSLLSRFLLNIHLIKLWVSFFTLWILRLGMMWIDSLVLIPWQHTIWNTVYRCLIPNYSTFNKCVLCRKQISCFCCLHLMSEAFYNVCWWLEGLMNSKIWKIFIVVAGYVCLHRFILRLLYK